MRRGRREMTDKRAKGRTKGGRRRKKESSFLSFFSADDDDQVRHQKPEKWTWSAQDIYTYKKQRPLRTSFLPSSQSIWPPNCRRIEIIKRIGFIKADSSFIGNRYHPLQGDYLRKMNGRTSSMLLLENSLARFWQWKKRGKNSVYTVFWLARWILPS